MPDATATATAATALGQLAAFTAGLTPATLPPAVVEKAKACLLDSLSAAVTFGAHPRARAALAAVPHDAPGHACRILGTPHRAAAADAAFVNGVATAATGRMDTHPAPASHPGTVVVPAVLAAAEQAGSDGFTLIAALVAGYEAMCRLGETLMTPALAETFRPTSLAGPTGAGFGAARALGLTPAQAVNAGSLAAQTSMGLNEWAHAGTNEGAFHSGFAARNGVTAALLGRAGAVAAPSVLEGRSGLLAAFGRREAAAGLTAGLGEGFAILAILHKPAPACVYVQTPVQLAEQLCREDPPALEDIEAVTIHVCHAAATYPGCDNPGPIPTQQAARMSLQYSVASVLAASAIRDGNWSDHPDPRAVALAARSRVVVEDAFTAAFPARQSAAIELRLRGRAPRRAEQADLRSLTWPELERRFLLAAEPVIGRSQALAAVEATRRLETLEAVGALTALLAPAAR
ncbi:MmgE/PrpD family protein [Siccirubricoccus phaeus]|uniref:MmgE/PrpD family protein n=1 Tax=Siccirubricoccus phaeus TaxID=2595053 RepID=UPI00165AF4E5|nr:MmgE/PrpD family protein [Siccirubricoccus phaeus]